MGEEKKEAGVKLPTIIVEFTSLESAMFDCRFVNFTPLAANYQMLAFSRWLEARCEYFMQATFDKQFKPILEAEAKATEPPKP